MSAIRHLPNEDRMRSIRAGVTTARRGFRIGIPENDTRKTFERPLTAGVSMALIVARRLLFGTSCIGLIAAEACLLGIDQQVP